MSPDEFPFLSRLKENMANRPIRKDLNPMKDAMGKHISLPAKTKIVQVVGSNGKGSFIHYCSKLLTGLKQEVVTYTSPHILRVGERIKVNGTALTKQQVNEHLREMPSKIRKELSPFETLFFLALRTAEFHAPDYLLLEAGMGGRWDATSALAADTTVLTGVELEHTTFLGDSLQEILSEQLAQIPEASHLWFVSIPPSLEQTLQEIIDSNNLTFSEVSSETNADLTARKLASEFVRREEKYEPSYVRNQIKEIPNPPGRLETVIKNGKPTIFDVAHTPNAIRNLLNFLLQFESADSWGMIYGSLEGKNCQKILKHLYNWSDEKHSITLTKPSGPRSLDPDELVTCWPDTGEKPPINSDPGRAYDYILDEVDPQGIVICGSFHLIRFFKKSWY